MKFLQLLRSFHAWLGVLTLPWIIAFGLTGFYLNHRDMVLSAISGPEINEADFPLLPNEALLDAAGAILIAQKLDVELAKQAPVAEIYHDADAFVFGRGDNQIIVDRETAYAFHKSAYQRLTYDRDLQMIDRKIYWPRLLKEFHTHGWLGGKLGTWLADIGSMALVLFGASGLYLFFWPRLRRWRQRRSA
jgi:hypothetical protein